MQLIRVRYLGATSSRPSRLVVEAEAGKLIQSWNYECSDGGAGLAAQALANKFQWGKVIAVGSFHNDTYYALAKGVKHVS